MEGLEAPVNATPAAAAPVAAAPAAPTPAAAPAPASQQSSGGGIDSIKDVFNNMNWTEVIFGVVGSAALFYTIYYYRYNLTMNKSFKTEIQNKIDDLTIKIADIQSASERDIIVNQSGFDGFY
jgi:hypothetical protein